MDPNVQSVCINASGKGFALVDVSYRYSIDTVETATPILLETNARILNDELISLEITTSYQPSKDTKLIKHSDIFVLEAAFPSGFIVNTESLNTLKSTLHCIKHKGTNNGDTLAVIYFEYPCTNSVTFKITGFRVHVVNNTKPASVVIYKYHNHGNCSFVSLGIYCISIFKKD